MNARRHGSAMTYGVVVLTVLAGSGVVWGQSDQPSLDELLNLAPDQPAVTEPDRGDTTSPDATQPINESVGEALSASQASDAFEQAIDEMDRVSRRLGRSLDPGIETQRMQESILRKLDQVIDAAKQQQSSGSGGGSGEPREQDPGSQQLAQQDADGAAGQPKPGGTQASTGEAGVTTPIQPEDQDTAIEQLRKEWGVLPPRVREELSDGLRERFSPLYRRMTEAYYKALAEQE